MILLALMGILGMAMVLVVIFSCLTMAKRAEEDLWRLTSRLEDCGYEEPRPGVEKGQIKQSSEELRKTNLAVAPRASAST